MISSVDAPEEAKQDSGSHQCSESVVVDLRQLVNSGCAPENRALLRALNSASAKEQRTWFSAINAWVEN